jgi:protein-tyrosine phosphatase
VQVTAGSCTGRFGRQAKAAAERLIESRLVHFVASDAHDCTHRPPVLTDAYTRLADSFGEERIRPMFVDNPRAVLTGEPIDVELPRPGARRRRWYQFWSG